MSPRRVGRWSGRPGMSEIEEQAVKLVAEFKRRLEAAGLDVPTIPPVDSQYIALTLTDFAVNGVAGLEVNGKPLSGLLDPDNEQICYEEREIPARQNFSIAHELGHYFLHYQPQSLQAAQQLVLFEFDNPDSETTVQYFRCTASDLADDEPGAAKSLLNDAETQSRLAKIIRLKEYSDRLEWEANVFAAGLLMPKDLVRWLNKKHGGDIRAMAAELNVSPAALRYRLSGMGLRHADDKIPQAKNKSTKNENADTEQGSFF